MIYNYEEITNELGAKSILKTDEDGKAWMIPTDPANSDYQAYLRWLNGEDESGTLS